MTHHPPVTAFASWDAALGCSYTGWVDISPRFTGLAIRVPMTGQRELKLAPVGTGEPPERYRATIPAMQWSFIPAVRAEYIGSWRLWCDETGLSAEVTHVTKNVLGFGKPNRLHGRVWRTTPGGAHAALASESASPRRRRSADAELLFEFEGCFVRALRILDIAAHLCVLTLSIASTGRCHLAAPGWRDGIARRRRSAARHCAAPAVGRQDGGGGGVCCLAAAPAA